MIKKIAWNTFKQTGDIATFLELKQFERTAKNVEDDFGDGGKNQVFTQNDFGDGDKNQVSQRSEIYPKIELQTQNNNQNLFQTNIEKAVDNFWNNINNS